MKKLIKKITGLLVKYKKELGIACFIVLLIVGGVTLKKNKAPVEEVESAPVEESIEVDSVTTDSTTTDSTAVDSVEIVGKL
jgi:PBP1b-binding outer membrane lipoprotein LpoB